MRVRHTWPWPVSPMTGAGFVTKNTMWSKVKTRLLRYCSCLIRCPPRKTNSIRSRVSHRSFIRHYLTLALIKGGNHRHKTVDVEIIEAVLSPDLNTLEPKLARHGYNTTALCEHLNARRNEIKAYFNGQLPAPRADEFN